MVKFKYFLVFIICFLSCKNEMKFDSIKWNLKDDVGMYIYRKNMINDIIENNLVKGKNIKDLENMFGTLEVGYLDNKKVIIQNIETDFGLNIDPVGYTDFIIYLNDENRVTNYKIVSIDK